MYKLKLNRREKKELAYVKWLLIVLAVVGVGVVVWLAWVRPEQKAATIDSFATCQAAGYPIQASYPEVCLTPAGKRFVNPKQAAAHDASLQDSEELTPPSNPELLYLAIDEWKVKVPLTEATFDLIYTYVEDGSTERVTFNFKRLVNAGVCPGDAGISLTRSPNKHNPPFTPDNPLPTAQVGNYYYYVAYGGSPCYDTHDAQQAAAVKQIAGDQSLTQAISKLVSGLQTQ